MSAEINSISNSVEESPPALPPRRKSNSNNSKENHSMNSTKNIKIDLDDKVSQILAIRQYELCNLPQLNEISDLFSITNVDEQKLKQDLKQYKLNESSFDNETFWIKYLDDLKNDWLRKKEIDEFESEIIKGIPDNLRYLVYIKSLQIRYKLSNKSSFETLTNESKFYRQDLDAIQNLSPRAKSVLAVYRYFKNKNLNSKEMDIQTYNEDSTLNSLITGFCDLLSNVSELAEEDLFYFLLKIEKMYEHLNKDELHYKINRSLEVEDTKLFEHITSQGVNLFHSYNSIIINLFNNNYFDRVEIFKIFDFIILEGFDFVIKIILYLFKMNKEKLANVSGDELMEYMRSKDFLNNEFDFQQIVQQEFQLIKFENEFYLISANSLNNNNNELMKLKEINQDLKLKIEDLNNKINNLQITHDEISVQSKDYTENLDKAKAENAELQSLKKELDLKYEQLTMKENLNNTIKANKEFSERNSELEQQINGANNSIKELKSKLAKKKSV
ncbi:unnamed protein product [Candida verbasci]|uniref:Oxidant-induced cell-cycle arrest protein 5 n=1 Tax=Candida verbasci TaxID=1227364 RepID=A0A9W4TXM0_9ASCO|nr:unnamed protein product [Candida verbasci]